MEFSVLFQVLGLVTLIQIAQAVEAHAGTGAIVARDTDKVSDIRQEIMKLKKLLSATGDGDENDLERLAERKDVANFLKKTAVASEDMGRQKLKQEAPAQSSTSEVQKLNDEKQIDKDLVPQDSSIHILARALARLKDPTFNNDDSTGDHLDTEANEAKDDKRTREMEIVITKALTQLDQDKNDNSQSKTQNDGLGSYLSQQPTKQELALRDEAIRVVENRLGQDILLVRKLGLNVDDIIEDLDKKSLRGEIKKA